MDNTALARFITSLGSLNSYGSTVYQTKLALDQKSTKPLRQDNADVAIFTDALKGIRAIQKIGFSTDGIIAVNRQFDSPSDEEPNMPGHLRNAYYNDDDRTAILVSTKGSDAYFPPDVVTRADLDNIVDRYQASPHHESDAWRVFAELAKLQPFQDGNKRTALIAANAAYGTLQTGEYLILPANDLDRAEFTLMLMRYYNAKNNGEEKDAFQRMLALLPSKADRLQALAQPIEDKPGLDSKTIRIKHEFRNDEKH